MQIESVTFKNFKVLRDTTLPLSRMTLLIGPNGSGKSTAFEAFDWMRASATSGCQCDSSSFLSLGVPASEGPATALVEWSPSAAGLRSRVRMNDRVALDHGSDDAFGHAHPELDTVLRNVRIYAFDARCLRSPVGLQREMELSRDGSGLAGVLDRLRDNSPERFARLNAELPRWFPEYDQVLFEVPGSGARGVLLRVAGTDRRVPARDLSEGTLLALGMLTLAHLPSPPSIVCIEEPDRGVHPRLLRNIHDALTRLAYPEASGDSRPPVQVIVTTHSPYFLDLYRDHPEDIVIAEREDGEAKFKRLSDLPDIAEILADAPLGDIWYSGVLGGVPATK